MITCCRCGVRVRAKPWSRRERRRLCAFHWEKKRQADRRARQRRMAHLNRQQNPQQNRVRIMESQAVTTAGRGSLPPADATVAMKINHHCNEGWYLRHVKKGGGKVVALHVPAIRRSHVATVQEHLHANGQVGALMAHN